MFLQQGDKIYFVVNLVIAKLSLGSRTSAGTLVPIKALAVCLLFEVNSNTANLRDNEPTTL
jgi:hypothetical protein